MNHQALVTFKSMKLLFIYQVPDRCRMIGFSHWVGLECSDWSDGIMIDCLDIQARHYMNSRKVMRLP